MIKDIKELQNKVANFKGWIQNMASIETNPYITGLKTDKMLEDLAQFADEISNDLIGLESKATETEPKDEPEEVEAEIIQGE